MSRTPSRPFRVGRARTGLGLFATRPIGRGETVVAYRGRRITAEQAWEIECKGHNRYLFEINSRWTIDGSSRRNSGRYINHACEPNAYAVLRRTGRLEFAAARRIEAGEEITIDYGEDYFDLLLAPKGCRCMACDTRGTRKTQKVGAGKGTGNKKKGGKVR